jgi:hypothetical protein
MAALSSKRLWLAEARNVGPSRQNDFLPNHAYVSASGTRRANFRNRNAGAGLRCMTEEDRTDAGQRGRQIKARRNAGPKRRA